MAYLCSTLEQWDVYCATHTANTLAPRVLVRLNIGPGFDPGRPGLLMYLAYRFESYRFRYLLCRLSMMPGLDFEKWKPVQVTCTNLYIVRHIIFIDGHA